MSKIDIQCMRLKGFTSADVHHEHRCSRSLCAVAKHTQAPLTPYPGFVLYKACLPGPLWPIQLKCMLINANVYGDAALGCSQLGAPPNK